MHKISNVTLRNLSQQQAAIIIFISAINNVLSRTHLEDQVAELFFVAHLFGSELCNLPSIWSELLNVLNARGSSIWQNSSCWVLLQLAYELYSENEYHSAAIEIASKTTVARQKVRKVSTDPFSNATFGDNSTVSVEDGPNVFEHTAHNIAMRLKNFNKNLVRIWASVA